MDTNRELIETCMDFVVELRIKYARECMVKEAVVVWKIDRRYVNFCGYRKKSKCRISEDARDYFVPIEESVMIAHRRDRNSRSLF